MPAEFSKPRAMPRLDGKVRLGLFLPNQKNAHYITSATGATDATYEDVREVALVADEIGLSFLLPVARWKGMAGEHTDFCPYGLETVTLAAGLLEATKRIVVFSTVHTELWNPAMLAKMGSVLDHIGNGRWGLNIVAGWNQADFQSLGVELRGHQDRYRHAEEWIAAVKDLWLNGVSSYQGESFKLDGAECRPRPVQEGGPVVVNAGRSRTGMQFAADHADYLFSADATGEQFKEVTEEIGGDVGYIGRKQLIVRETDAEAQAVADAIVSGADKQGLAQLYAHGASSVEEARKLMDDSDHLRSVLLEGAAVGSPASVAVQIAEWVRTSHVDGINLSLFDYVRELTLLDGSVIECLGNELEARGLDLVIGE